MNLLLAQCPASIAFDPQTSSNLLSKSFAVSHNIDIEGPICALQLTALQSDRGRSVVINFTPVDDLVVDAVLGQWWSEWCSVNKSASLHITTSYR